MFQSEWPLMFDQSPDDAEAPPQPLPPRLSYRSKLIHETSDKHKRWLRFVHISACHHSFRAHCTAVRCDADTDAHVWYRFNSINRNMYKCIFITSDSLWETSSAERIFGSAPVRSFISNGFCADRVSSIGLLKSNLNIPFEFCFERVWNFGRAAFNVKSGEGDSNRRSTNLKPEDGQNASPSRHQIVSPRSVFMSSHQVTDITSTPGPHDDFCSADTQFNTLV